MRTDGLPPRVLGSIEASPRGVPIGRCAGFTLLELFVAFTLLALFVLPILSIVHTARVRAARYAIENEVQELARRKLFDRIYTYSDEAFAAGAMEAMSGTFAEQGRPQWTWEIPYPQVINTQGEQVILEYTIRVYAPQLTPESGGTGELGGLSDLMAGGTPSREFRHRTLPSAAWYLEQQDLIDQGIDPMMLQYDTFGPGGSF